MNGLNISGFNAIPVPPIEEHEDKPIYRCEECGAGIYDGEECVEVTIKFHGERETIHYCANCATPVWAGR